MFLLTVCTKSQKKLSHVFTTHFQRISGKLWRATNHFYLGRQEKDGLSDYCLTIISWIFNEIISINTTGGLKNEKLIEGLLNEIEG